MPNKKAQFILNMTFLSGLTLAMAGPSSSPNLKPPSAPVVLELKSVPASAVLKPEPVSVSCSDRGGFVSKSYDVDNNHTKTECIFPEKLK